MVNSALQWTGTSCLIVMYVLMSFYPELHPWNIVAGCLGGLCYFTWSLRTRNRAQIIVNAVGITVCIAGLVKAFSG